MPVRNTLGGPEVFSTLAASTTPFSATRMPAIPKLNSGMSPPFDLEEVRSLFPQFFYDKSRLSQLISTVTCDGLHEDNLEQKYFCRELQARREWMAAHCQSDWAVEPVRDSLLRLTGRAFRFANPEEALAFRLHFPTTL